MANGRTRLIQTVGRFVEPLTKRYVRRLYQDNLKLTVPEGERILVLAPHVDDETIGLGGTILAHKEQGADVTVVYLTDGAGSQGVSDKEALKAARRKEAEAVRARFRLDEVVFLDAPDGGLGEAVNDAAFLERFEAVVGQTDPTVIYLPTMVDCHPDHRATGELLMGLSGDVAVRLYEINTAIPPERINVVVDISAYAGEKAAATAIFKSQVIDFDGFLTLSSWKTGLVDADRHAPRQVETFLGMSLGDFQAVYPVFRRYEVPYEQHLKQMNKTATLMLALGKNRAMKSRWYDKAMGEGSK
ncbi:PIG-L deacetylase family protein [Salisediminibacterium selenitireducens]|uniref:LmbE family protein n=1 Tax=Bacillus selenitireducens (strain ATCC 700615 / DSM 15326 / MLS10) TaxID=439292 RepID=D6Y041_BACIE|nr:PIG-L family deacetylase [Salisediminibacterium selenitireducens]ADI00543.1 LmbE family protein [[Bacillus] selenitireducens MLS10]